MHEMVEIEQRSEAMGLRVVLQSEQVVEVDENPEQKRYECIIPVKDEDLNEHKRDHQVRYCEHLGSTNHSGSLAL
jgi:hypothetical protein